MRAPKKTPRRSILRVSAGIALIASSVVGAQFVLDSGGAMRPALIADQTLTAGSSVGPTDVRVIDLAEDSALGSYFDPPSIEGLVLARDIDQGELLTRNDFVEPSLREDSMLTVPLSVGEPEWLVSGQLVQVWVAPPAAENAFSAPFVLSPEAVIARVSREEGFAASGQESLVDIRVPARDVPAMIHAIANGYFVHLAPVKSVL